MIRPMSDPRQMRSGRDSARPRLRRRGVRVGADRVFELARHLTWRDREMGLSDEVCVVGVTDLACVPGRDRREAVGVAAILARAWPGKDPHRYAGDDREVHWAAWPPRQAREGAEAPEELQGRLAGLLPADARQDALKGLDPEEITGQGGLLTQLAGCVIDAALAGELSDHLGYPPGQAPPGGAGNHRNGSTGDGRDGLGPGGGEHPPRSSGHVPAEAGR
jgi:hypothetical protein